MGPDGMSGTEMAPANEQDWADWIPKAGMQMQLCQEMQKELEKFKVTWDQNNDSEWILTHCQDCQVDLNNFSSNHNNTFHLWKNPFPLIKNIPKKGL